MATTAGSFAWIPARLVVDRSQIGLSLRTRLDPLNDWVGLRQAVVQSVFTADGPRLLEAFEVGVVPHPKTCSRWMVLVPRGCFAVGDAGGKPCFVHTASEVVACELLIEAIDIHPALQNAREVAADELGLVPLDDPELPKPKIATPSTAECP